MIDKTLTTHLERNSCGFIGELIDFRKKLSEVDFPDDWMPPRKHISLTACQRNVLINDFEAKI